MNTSIGIDNVEHPIPSYGDIPPPTYYEATNYAFTLNSAKRTPKVILTAPVHQTHNTNLSDERHQSALHQPVFVAQTRPRHCIQVSHTFLSQLCFSGFIPKTSYQGGILKYILYIHIFYYVSCFGENYS